MPGSAPSLFDQWRDADRKAHAAELALMKASTGVQGRHGPVPTEEQIVHAQQLRQAADHLFALAMAEMQRRAGIAGPH